MVCVGEGGGEGGGRRALRGLEGGGKHKWFMIQAILPCNFGGQDLITTIVASMLFDGQFGTNCSQQVNMIQVLIDTLYTLAFMPQHP